MTASPQPGTDAHTRATLKARALTLAAPAVDPASQNARTEVVEFSLAKERYAIAQSAIREVCRLHQLTPLPGAPAFVAGIINVRGQFVCVIDIKTFFDLPAPGITDLHAVIIVQHAGVEVGILADLILGTRSVDPQSLQKSLPTLSGIRAEYLLGITDDHTVVLDALKLLASPSLLVDQAAAP